MARGFWRGLFHGGLVSGAALAALSLAFPIARHDQPPAEPEPVEAVEPAPTDSTQPEEARPDTVEAQPETPEPAAPEQSASATTETEPQTASDAAPSADAVDLPVGSEFGRGGDVAPQMPSPLALPDARMAPAEAPAVSAPAAEPAPVMVQGDNRRPETEQADGPALATPEDGGAAPDLSRPGSLAVPQSPARPQMAGAEAQDDAPQRPSAAQTRTAPAAEDATEAAPPSSQPDPAGDRSAPRDEPSQPVPSPADAQVDLPASPALPSPSLDLSLPPDLSDLRKLERD